MKKLAVLLIVSLFSGCAARQPQQLLRNQPPWRALAAATRVFTLRGGGLGVVISGGRILTAHHISGTPVVGWKGGYATRLDSAPEKDLALYQAAGEAPLNYAVISPRGPELGEEVYWPVLSQTADLGMARGFVHFKDSESLRISGWFHPGTSGSPVFRSDGTLVGIMQAGHNWACQGMDGPFQALELEEQLACLYRMTGFPPEMYVRRITPDLF